MAPAVAQDGAKRSAQASNKRPAADKPVRKSAQPAPVKRSAATSPSRPQARSQAAASPRKQSATVQRAVAAAPARVSYGQAFGLHAVEDPLDLKSSVALVLDQETEEVLFAKNSQAVLPIASLTKLMTALVVIEADQPLQEMLTITREDIDTEKGSSSRLAVGTRLSREEMLHLALMSSENRAANALGRHYPGGLRPFVAAMNRKARELGMNDTRFVEPTGLSSRNQSSARDLAVLVKATYGVPLIRELSTSHEYQVVVGKRQLQYRNTNGLVFNPNWEIGLQKTGYISEAGRCLVMQAELAGRKLIMVFLDSAGRFSRLGDAERVRSWLLDHGLASPLPAEDDVDVPRVTS
ncbi:D-alanyl-D-alanine endopeptidase [Zhizhongheella caldifontis]|uniref:D-alanyl-D-alanine endopeptidase n=1 Tax=Caldimonas caldifontis TaxID=1452508 RepID=A0A2S5STI2_9BURK|nr:D-alanyl-D-alanine endopeptidase [Caldimonas caldifontis]